MRKAKVLPILILSWCGAFAAADDDEDCQKYDNDRAREACWNRKYDNVNCSELDNDRARSECRQRKHGADGNEGVDCRNVDSDLRDECRERKRD